jgi:hypothetical protein
LNGDVWVFLTTARAADLDQLKAFSVVNVSGGSC